MEYFYATRKDKQDRLLITSYGKKEQAKKFGGSEARIAKGIYYLDENGQPTTEETGIVLRSKLVNNNVDLDVGEGQGNFVLYKQEGKKFVPTSFRFMTYGNANNAMKTMVTTFGTLLVVEELQARKAQQPDLEPEEELDDGVVPFAA